MSRHDRDTRRRSRSQRRRAGRAKAKLEATVPERHRPGRKAARGVAHPGVDPLSSRNPRLVSLGGPRIRFTQETAREERG